ncbi:DUF2155 domain-containing protein [Gymnodinialimonas sp.]
MRVFRALCLSALVSAAPAMAQQFDVIDGDGTFDGFQLDTGQGDGTGLTLSEGATGDIELNLGTGGAGALTTFPGVTGPVTSISQPATELGAVVSLRALDKMLGQPTDIELSMGQTVVFGRVAIRVIECRFPTADPEGDAFAHLEVLDLEGESLFDGWMIASSPALNALEHARYDVWVLGCSA